jgi:hypothetical protein
LNLINFKNIKIYFTAASEVFAEFLKEVTPLNKSVNDTEIYFFLILSKGCRKILISRGL